MANDPQTTQSSSGPAATLPVQNLSGEPNPDAGAGDPPAEASTDPAARSSAARIRTREQAGGPPTEPRESTAGPQDALAGTPQSPAATGGVAARPLGEDEDDRRGPEDALDPYADNRGDYSDRVEDAVHLHHAPVEDPAFGEPRSVPVAQNRLGDQHLEALSDRVERPEAVDPAHDVRDRLHSEGRDRGELDDDGEPVRPDVARAEADDDTNE